MYTVRVILIDGRVKTYKGVHTTEYSQKYGMLYLKTEKQTESLRTSEFESFKIII